MPRGHPIAYLSAAMGIGDMLMVPTSCEAAVRYVTEGWPVVPTRLPLRFTPAGARGAVSRRDLVSGRPPADPGTARDWWSERPYGIAAITGVLFDVLVLPESLGRSVVAACAPRRPATIVHPEGFRLFLVTAGVELIPDFPRGCGVSVYGGGSHVLLPPTPSAGGALTWADADRAVVSVAHSLSVQWAAVRSLVGSPGHRRQTDHADGG